MDTNILIGAGMEKGMQARAKSCRTGTPVR